MPLAVGFSGISCSSVLENNFSQMRIPFPEALNDANVNIRYIDENKSKSIREGLVIGNGEINAIVYISGNDLMLRVSKNDVWDGRIDTSEDPALPVIDPANRTFYRETIQWVPPSWKKPFPIAVPSADIILSGIEQEANWEMTLNLEKAVATVSTSTEKTILRALAHANVFYIKSPRPIEIVGIPQDFHPTPSQGITDDGIKWLRQRIPGNDDIKGMDVYLAVDTKGPYHAVSVATSTDTVEPLKEAIRLLREVLIHPEENVVMNHEFIWKEFWSKSGIQLSNIQFQNWWYRMVYYFRCFAKKGATAVGLKASHEALAGWHNSYKFNYNIQQTFFSAGPINHPELAEPLIEVLINYWPRAKWFAQNCFVGCEGAFVHSDVFHPQEPIPIMCKTKNNHQFAYIPWGYTLGMQGHISLILWEHYQYKPDRFYLKSKTYPLLRDIALFYCSFLEQCKKDEFGKILIGPSYFPENGPFGQFNVAYDIPYIIYGLKAAGEAAGILNTDKVLVERINSLLTRMPSYETLPDTNQENKPVVIWYKGSKFPDDDRHASLIQAVFPSGQITQVFT
jgi:hypothetical protein